jgi:uncharacterized membrane protein YoaK (UPF0700 family)
VSWPSGDQLRDGLLIGLTFVAGWVDAVAYVSLGRVFTANMTGNLVLLGINAGEDQLIAAIRSAVALACFALGALLGGLITRRTRPEVVWPRQATLAMTAELVLLLAFAVGWLRARVPGDPPIGDVLVALGAAAMGLQSAAARHVAVAGVSTTYVTGTLTSLMAELAALSGSADRYRWAQVLVAIVLGAWLGTLSLAHWPITAPIVPVLVLLGVVAIAFARLSPLAPSAPSARGSAVR